MHRTHGQGPLVILGMAIVPIAVSYMLGLEEYAVISMYGLEAVSVFFGWILAGCKKEKDK